MPGWRWAYFTGIFSVEWGLSGHRGHVLFSSPVMSWTSVSHLTVGMLYNLSKPRD